MVVLFIYLALFAPCNAVKFGFFEVVVDVQLIPCMNKVLSSKMLIQAPFTIVCFVTLLLSGGQAGIDFVLIDFSDFCVMV